ncbi:MAG: efflux RND transporter periplasmic adaptor subunit [Acidobacteria bacterium]|nr:efflux RND transporter periplasmic adaptor subunit [Acidobacteriota bacterium]
MGMDRIIKKKRWTLKKITLILVSVAFLAAVIYGFLSQEKGTALNVDLEKLTIATVEKGPFQEYIPVNGNVLPLQEFFLVANEGGKVEQIFIREGTLVEPGDQIMKLSNADLQLEYLSRETQLLDEQNRLRTLKLELEQSRLQLKGELMALEHEILMQKRTFLRNQDLFNEKLLSTQDYENSHDQYEYLLRRKDITVQTHEQTLALSQAEIEKLNASIIQTESHMRILQSKMDDLIIRAPISGQLTSLNAEIGQFKAPGQSIGQIDVLDGFRVQAEIDEYYLPRIDRGQIGEVEVSGQTFTLETRIIYPEVIDSRFKTDMYFTGETPAGLKRGQTLKIRLQLGDLTEAVLLARGGFYQHTGGNWVYMLDEGGTVAKKRSIKLNRYNPRFYEVIDGLKPGDQVIVSSYDHFGDHDRLILK